MKDEQPRIYPSAPKIPVPADDEDELNRRCKEERELMAPNDTADCAGVAWAEEYANEEDGGS